MGRVFRALDAALKEEGFEVYYDDRAENLVDEIVLFTQGKN